MERKRKVMMSQNGFRLFYQSDLNEQELVIAKFIFEWFKEEAYSGKVYFDLKSKKWITDTRLKLPSWKHLTRGGHKNGVALCRGDYGMRCDLRAGHINKDTAKTLVFKRISNHKRDFAIQRTNTIQILGSTEISDSCPCKSCLSDIKSKNLLTKNEYTLYSTSDDTQK